MWEGSVMSILNQIELMESLAMEIDLTQVSVLIVCYRQIVRHPQYAAGRKTTWKTKKIPTKILITE